MHLSFNRYTLILKMHREYWVLHSGLFNFVEINIKKDCFFVNQTLFLFEAKECTLRYFSPQLLVSAQDKKELIKLFHDYFEKIKSLHVADLTF